MKQLSTCVSFERSPLSHFTFRPDIPQSATFRTPGNPKPSPLFHPTRSRRRFSFIQLKVLFTYFAIDLLCFFCVCVANQNHVQLNICRCNQKKNDGFAERALYKPTFMRFELPFSRFTRKQKSERFENGALVAAFSNRCVFINQTIDSFRADGR